METQLTFLNVVIWEKNQKKTREKIQNASAPYQQQQ